MTKKSWIQQEQCASQSKCGLCNIWPYVNHSGVCLLAPLRTPVKQLDTANENTKQDKLKVWLHLMLWSHVIKQLGPDPQRYLAAWCSLKSGMEMLTCKALLLGEFSEAHTHQISTAFPGSCEPRGLSIAFGCFSGVLSTCLGIYISLRLLPVELWSH